MKMRDYLREGKSENYQDAESKGLLKAGEAAAILSRKFAIKITAKELRPFAKEWHHAGVFKAGNSIRGQRVYFFSHDGLEKITLEQILLSREQQADTKRPAGDVQGWYVQFFRTTDPHSRRNVSLPFLGVYKGPAAKAPKGLKPLSDAEFAVAEKQKGRQLKPFEQCDFSH